MNRSASCLRTIRLWLVVVIAGLLLSGITAFPLLHEIQWLAGMLNIAPGTSPENYVGLRHWIARVREGLEQTNLRYPFLAYGTDWLAFAHIILAILFLGPLRDPVRNVWVINFGIIACLGIIPLAMICGHIRGIPLGWRCIDCAFGILAIGPLWICRRAVAKLPQ
jgi:hypothetical protein